MSSLTDGPVVKQRLKSRIDPSRFGAASPEGVISYRSVAAPGAVGIRLWVAECRCKLVEGIEVHTTAGAGSSKIYLRKHLAAHVAAPDAATATTNIVDLISGGAPADSTVNVAQDLTLVAADCTFEEGDKLMLVTPATLAGVLVQLLYVRL